MTSIKTRLHHTKGYLIDHAPQIVTAVSVVGLAIYVVKNSESTASAIKGLNADFIEVIQATDRNKERAGLMIDACLDLKIPYEHYAGVGVRPMDLDRLGEIWEWMGKNGHGEFI